MTLPALVEPRMTDLHLLVEEAGTYDEMVALGRQITHAQETTGWVLKFALGDLANRAVSDGDYDTLRAFAEEVGIEYATLRGYVATAKAFPVTSRHADVSYKAHAALAGDPERHALLAELVSESNGTPSVRAAQAKLAETKTARAQAIASSNARSQGALAQHGADDTNVAEVATPAKSAGYSGPMPERGLAAPWETVPTPAGPVEHRAPAPRMRGGQSIESVGDVVGALEIVATALACMELNPREAERLRTTVADLYEDIAEAEKAGREAA